jgi:phosphoribosylformylglycinamidine cyclo-ligase
LIGLPSTGLHTNGYSLARKLLFDVAGHAPAAKLPGLEDTLASELLKPHRAYLKPLQKLHGANVLKAAVHVTGGGITENTPRVLPKGLGARVHPGAWPVLPIFELLRKIGNIPEDDYRRTFNLGIGMIFIVAKGDLSKARKLLDRLEEPNHEIGEVIDAPNSGPRVVWE